MSPPIAIEPQAVTDTQAATFTDRLSINGVEARRIKAPKISGVIAAHATSEMFKGPGYGKPKAKRWDHRLSEESKSRKPSQLKAAGALLGTPGLISLGGGLPSSAYFPFERLDVKVPKPPHFSEEETKKSGILSTAGKHDFAEGKSIYDMHIAFNYGQASGSAQLLRFVTEHTEIVHHPPYQDWQCCLTVGNTSALDMALRMFTTRGDYILMDDYTFASAVETAVPMGLHCLGVPMDSEGLIPSSLNEMLTNWDPAAHNNALKPFILYLVPTGQNPTGTTQSEHRRKEIYAIAQKHDLYILEDEPYYFLQMQPYTGPNAPAIPPPASHEDFLASLVPSYLSMDTDGRVMRMDSFSKVIAPGTRTGWIVASEQIIERYVRHSEVTVQNPSGMSQLILFKLLEETWGHSGYLDWLIYMRMEYTARRDVICGAAEKYLPKEVARWEAPGAGMFLWIRILHHAHPSTSSHSTLEEEVFRAGFEAGVLVAKGSWFCAEQDAKSQQDTKPKQDKEVRDGEAIFFRMTFAAASHDAIEEGVKRFGRALRGVFGLEMNGHAVENGVENGVEGRIEMSEE